MWKVSQEMCYGNAIIFGVIDMKPSDIHSFWSETIDRLGDVPINAVVKLNENLSDREFATYDVVLSSYENVSLRGWYSVPNDISEERRGPGILAVPGYQGNKNIPTQLVVAGYCVFTLFPRGQGESVSEWALDAGTKLTYHIEDKSHYYYRGAYMDCIRGLDFLQSRDEVIPDRLGMWSRSQGGGFTLATAALDNRLNVAVAEEPFLCNFPVAVDLESSPYSELRDYLSQNPKARPLVLDTLSYFDQLNLVSGIHCPTLVNIGMRDQTCPWETIEPVFKEIPSIKSLCIYPELNHSPCTDFSNHASDWIRRYI